MKESDFDRPDKDGTTVMLFFARGDILHLNVRPQDYSWV